MSRGKEADRVPEFGERATWERVMELRSSTFGNDGQIAADVTRHGPKPSRYLTRNATPKAAQSRLATIDDPQGLQSAASQTTRVRWGLHETCELRPSPMGAGEGLDDGACGGEGSTRLPIDHHGQARKSYSLDTGLPRMILPSKAAPKSATRDRALDAGARVGGNRR